MLPASTDFTSWSFPPKFQGGGAIDDLILGRARRALPPISLGFQRLTGGMALAHTPPPIKTERGAGVMTFCGTVFRLYS